MFSQEPISKSMSNNNNTMLFFNNTTNFKNDSVGEEQQNPNGLARYRSAPSSFFANFLDGLNVNNTNSDSSQDGDNEAENMFSAFMGSSNLHDLQQYSLNLKQEMTDYDQQKNGVSNVNSSQLGYESFNETGNGNGNFGGRNDQNLLRQSSSPAGFFAGFDISREVENFKSIGESNSTSNGVNRQLNFTSRQSTPARFMPSIAEDRNESIGTGSSKDGQLRNGNNSIGRSYISGSFNDSSSSSLKRNHVCDLKFSSFDTLETEKADSRNMGHGLTHHLSLTKTSSEMDGIEKYLDFQQDNVVTCKLRAKRGFATHPRSIAERVRRTRISDRMKKLQELFPNMDKQTNTADMLDLAAEHIKQLQKQVQTLNEVKAKCKCLK